MIFPLVTLLDLSASSERNENIKNNKITEEMKENLNDNEGSDHVDGRLRELGARPKTVNTSLTMDIRWEMSCSQWTFFMVNCSGRKSLTGTKRQRPRWREIYLLTSHSWRTRSLARNLLNAEIFIIVIEFIN